jgi:hypothetical protein
MRRLSKQVFRMIKHVWSGDFERVVRMIVVQSSLFTVWEPDFLQEDNCGFGVAQEVREIVSVSLEAFYVEGEH